MSVPSPGASRMKTDYQHQIDALVDGYFSAVSSAAALRNLLIIWFPPGVVMVLVGTLALFSPGSVFAGRSIEAFVFGVRWAVSALMFGTILGAVVWIARSWSNIPRLGRSARLGVGRYAKRHLPAFIAAAALGIAAIFMADIRDKALFLAAVLVLSFPHSLQLTVLRLFWQTSTGGAADYELPLAARRWFSGWTMFVSGLVLAELPGISDGLSAIALLLQGVGCLVAAYYGLGLFGRIAERQDVRLREILDRRGLDDHEVRREVTPREIETAWQDSEGLVSFDF